ncbi:MAG TPA: DUF1835 domain-containing protein [Thermoanaerobaculia bacterium]|nr:DUF1835 domain-containing protein [Thermoanaerobaculia bacterium]
MANPDPSRSLTAADLMRQLGFRFPAGPALQVSTAKAPAPPLADSAAAPLAKSIRSAPVRRMLHVTNGDIAAELIRAAGISGEVSVTADVLHEGPAPGGLPPERWRKVRARHLAESGYEDYESALATLTRWDHTLEDYRSYDEVILWFEHDLFDQLLLIRALDVFAGRNLGGTELSLICIGEYLGHLAPPQMAALLEGRQRVNEGQKLLARDAWRAFCYPDPTRLEALLHRDTSPLPFLAGALRRHLEEFPSIANGLSRSERQTLRALADGASTFEELFRATQRMEERVYMGDSSFHRILRELAAPPRPLVRLEAAPSAALRALRVSLTTSGREVMEERDDWVRSRGIDRWLGGVHLQGSEAAWRWDGKAGRLVKT